MNCIGWPKCEYAADQESENSKVVNHSAVRTFVVDLDKPEGESKWGSVSGIWAGIRHLHDSLPKSKESQIRALERSSPTE